MSKFGMALFRTVIDSMTSEAVQGDRSLTTPADLPGQDPATWPRAIYHTVVTLAVMAAVVYVTIWCWSRNPGMQGRDNYAAAKHWSDLVWTFGLAGVFFVAWLIWNAP